MNSDDVYGAISHLGFHFRDLEHLLRQYQLMKTAQGSDLGSPVH